MRLFASLVLFSGVCASMAFAEDKPAPKEEKITFEQHILPIFREKCGSCHNSNDKKGDLVLDNYGLAMQGGASGEVVRSDGDASLSQLYLVVSHQSEPKMPPAQPKLPDEQLTLIRKWIEGGALENSGSKAKPKKNVSVTKVTVSNQRPAGPPPMPENLPLNPVVVASRGNGVTAMAANPWSTVIAVAGHKQIVLFDARTREVAGVLPFPEGVAHVLKFSRDGQWLLAGGGRGGHSGKVVLWDIKTGKRLAEVGNEYDVVLAADVSPDHTQVALGGPKKIVRVYDTSTGELLYEKNKHTDWITAIEFSPDGVLLATADRSNGLVVWEAFTGREFYFLTGHTAAITDVSWSPDSNILATCSEDTTIRLWEMQNGGQVKNWGAHGGGALAVEFTRDNRIASTGRDNVAKLWDMNGAAIRGFPGLTDIGMEVAFDADDDYILAGDLNGVISIWNAKDGAVIGQLTTNPPTLTKQIEITQQNLANVEAQSNQAIASLAGLNKNISDRMNAAQNAAKVAADTAAVLDATMKSKVAADADLVAKTQALQVADKNQNDTQVAFNKANEERDAVNKQLADLLNKVKAATDAVEVEKAATAKAQTASDEKPDDVALKTALQDANKKLADALAAQAEVSKQSGAVAQDLTAKSQTLTAATGALNTTKQAKEKATAEKVAADDNVAKLTAKLKADTDATVAAKAASDKAAAEAVVTPEQQKQLADLDVSVKKTAEQVASVKGQLQRLIAAKDRPALTEAIPAN